MQNVKPLHYNRRMPSLSDRLKSLGVKVGASDLSKAQPDNKYEIDRIVSGSYRTTRVGDTFVSEKDRRKIETLISEMKVTGKRI